MAISSEQDRALRRRDVAYYRRRQQNRVYAALTKFLDEEFAAGRISRKELADKLAKNPSQISRWLAAPSNLELDTLSDLLLAMDAEMDHSIVRFKDRLRANYMHPMIVTSTANISASSIGVQTQPVRQTPTYNSHTNSKPTATVVIE